MATAAMLLASAAPLAAQAGEWDAPRALALVREARAARAMPGDSGLSSYRATAEGHVYFYLDRPETGDRVLVKADQVALEVYWRAPHFTKQRIVGMRDESVLPNQMRYHIDHLTVVQDEFADRIRMGDGDEVRDVPHPAAPGSDSVYSFRLSDSLTLSLPGRPDPIRTYEVQFRPHDLDRPALIGSMFVDRATGAIVRLSFTFTPVSYVDPRLEEIRISLDNGLWEDRYWLPNEQRLEIRRQLPQFDVAVSSVIAGSFTINDYSLNEPIPLGFFGGPRVVALPPRMRERHEFRTGLMAGLEDRGLEPAPDLEHIEQTVKDVVRKRVMNGLPRLRPYFPSVSSAVRYNRAEEAFFAAGAALRVGDRSRLEGSLGYATGPGDLHGRLEGRFPMGAASVIIARSYARELRDLGQDPGPAGALNSLSTLFGGYDFLDPYHATGGSIGVSLPLSGGRRAGFGIAVEDHDAASVTAGGSLAGDGGFRPVRSIAEGRFVELTFGLTRDLQHTPGYDWYSNSRIVRGWSDTGTYATLDARMGLRWHPGAGIELALDGAAGTVGFGQDDAANLPPQKLFLLGGYGTLPGYPFRAYAGNRYGLARLVLARPLGTPLVRLRALAAAGWTDVTSGSVVPADWDVAETDGLRTSLGLGLGLLWDMVHLDAWNGLRGGDWQLLLSVNPSIREVF